MHKTTILDFGDENLELNESSDTIKKYDFRDFPQYKAKCRFEELKAQQKKMSGEAVHIFH